MPHSNSIFMDAIKSKTMTKSKKELLIEIYKEKKEMARLSFNNKKQPQSLIDEALDSYCFYERLINELEKTETED